MDEVDEAATNVEDAAAWIFFSDRVEYMAAVRPAPVAAETPAMIASVVLDMLERFELDGSSYRMGWEGYLWNED